MTTAKTPNPLANARTNFLPIIKDKRVSVKSERGSYTFDYAPIENILEATTGALSQEGISLHWETSSTIDAVTVTAVLDMPDNTQKRSSLTWKMPAKIQELGSVLTYLQRYSAEAVLGIKAQTDDDGNLADGNNARFERRTPPPVNLVQQLEQSNAAVANATKFYAALKQATTQPKLLAIATEIKSAKLIQKDVVELRRLYEERSAELKAPVNNNAGAALCRPHPHGNGSPNARRRQCFRNSNSHPGQQPNRARPCTGI